VRQHAVYQDEAAFMQTITQAREELRALFEQDAQANHTRASGARGK
jgi:hypothetical protein